MRKNHKSYQKLISFRKYSRKKYAVFNSLGKIIKISTLGAVCSLIISPVQGQSKTETDSVSKNLELEEVEVVGQKSSVLINDLPRMIEIIPAEAIKSSPAQSFHDLIGFLSNIDIRQRGPFGTQADLSIRGGSFDHTLVLLNGTNLSDPQTGHLSLDLPIDQESISKIEILNGPAARALGANAYSGALNISAKPSEENKVDISVHGGKYGFARTHLGYDFKVKKTKNVLTAGYSRCNGYIKNTDFTNYHLYYNGTYTLNTATSAWLQLGYSQKSFGANTFYSAKYTDEFESNKNIFFNTGISIDNPVKTKAQVYWRRHYDRFELYRESEDYYIKIPSGYFIKDAVDTAGYSKAGIFYPYQGHNYHVTDIFGTDITVTGKSVIGKTTLGGALRSENILSNQLGSAMEIPVPIRNTDSLFYIRQSSRNNFELFLEHSYQAKNLFLSFGTMINWNSYLPDEINLFPGLDFSYKFFDNLLFISSYNFTFGTPTFTDLYYQSPADKGNNLLKPYSQHSFESGLKYTGKNIVVKTVAFYTTGKDNIEWVLNDTSYKFSPINVNHSVNQGVEFSLGYSAVGNSLISMFISKIYLGYTYIDTWRDTPEAVSKYSNIRQKITMCIQHDLLNHLNLDWNFMYKERTGYYLTYNITDGGYIEHDYPKIFLLDARLTYDFKFAKVYIEGSNLLNCKYYESGSIPQPGRWIKAGLSVQLFVKSLSSSRT